MEGRREGVEVGVTRREGEHGVTRRQTREIVIGWRKKRGGVKVLMIGGEGEKGGFQGSFGGHVKHWRLRNGRRWMRGSFSSPF